MKHAFTVALVAVTALGCATAQESRNAAAKGASAARTECTPAPRELVKKDLAPGKGDKTVTLRSGIHVAYTGWLYDPCAKDFKGEKFDSSEGRPTPFGFVVGAGRVIKGWDQGLLGMKEGAKRTLIIPADMAYGAAGAGGGKIPPNAPLVFDVEIVGIPFPPPPPAPAGGPTQ